jgi:DNA-binding SARP family transcriptional activator
LPTSKHPGRPAFVAKCDESVRVEPEKTWPLCSSESRPQTHTAYEQSCFFRGGADTGRHLEIALLGGFRFWVRGRDALPDLPGGSQRLLAYLALRERTVARSAASGTLWPEASEEHAHASLRSAISRLTQIAHDAIVVSVRSVRLAGDVSVDIREARALAHRVLNPNEQLGEDDLSHRAIDALSFDLLPDWYDDWAIVEAEDWRQLRLHALDALTERLLANARHADAIGAALAAVRAEPLRETAHATLIRVFLADGNRSEALSAFERYRTTLKTELGLEPSLELQALIKDL